MVEAWKEASDKRAKVREEKKEAREQAKADKRIADAVAVARYVATHEGCDVRSARIHTVNDSSARWATAKAVLGAALVVSGRRPQSLSINASQLPEGVTL